MKRTWEETKLWKRIIKNTLVNKNEIIPFLKTTLDNVSLILNSANTSPTTFTLHDSDHSFRVAERMIQIIPGKTLNNLSLYELILLLLSAYLHDIGMTPLGNKISGHHDYLLSGEKGGLSDIEIDNFDIWLLDEKRLLRAPLGKGEKSKKDLKLARELIAYYFRDIHNDLSREWIEHNIKEEKLLNYLTFRTDLITLCQSHHWNIDELEDVKYNLKTISDGLNVNMKFIFCMLRMGDILENDPERTPKIIFEYREVFPTSEIYWHRDQSLKIKIISENDSKKLHIRARPKKALIQEAINKLVESIEDEIEICLKLLLNKKSDSYKWNLLPPIKKDIEPFPNTYTYIKGNFRINIEKTLQLLGGIQLYKDLGIAIRELLQNSFDAVKQQIALEQIENIKKGQINNIDKIRKSHLVKLTFKYENGNVYLECYDNGIGMSKDIIENSLLVIGEKNRPDINRIINKCEKYGIKLDLSSQFGIGFLSYFMIADEITINTKRSSLCDDEKYTGWAFTINGVGEWGELKKKKLKEYGTTIRLRLKHYALKYLDIYDSIFNFKSSYFINYIEQMCNCLPCKFQMYSKHSNYKFIDNSPGWSPNTELDRLKIKNDATSFILNSNKVKDASNRSLMLSEEEKNKNERFIKEANHFIEELKKSESFDLYEGLLPNNLGSYRIFIPLYKVSGEDSEFFFLEQNNNEEKISDKKLYKVIKDADNNEYSGYRQFGALLISYCGFNVENCDVFKKYKKYGFFIFDFNNDKHFELSVDRTTLYPSQEAQLIIENFIEELLKKRIKTICDNKITSFHFMNLQFYNVFEDNPENAFWICFNNNCFTFEKLQFPAIPSSEFDFYRFNKDESYFLNNIKINIIPEINIATSKCEGRFDKDNQINLNFFNLLDPSEIVYLNDNNHIKIYAVWTMIKKQASEEFFSCHFPSKWREIVHINTPSGLRIWNQSFPFYKEIVEQQKTDRWELINFLIKNNYDINSFPSNHFTNFNSCIKWLSTYVDLYSISGWANFNENPNFFRTLFNTLNDGLKYILNKIETVACVRENILEEDKLELSLLQKDGFKIIKIKDKILEMMNIQENCKEIKKIKDNSSSTLLNSFLNGYK